MSQKISTKKVLIIYTGGTIGMKQTPDGYAPIHGWMEQQLGSIYAFQDPNGPPRTTPPSKTGSTICYDIIEYKPLLDSANMETHHWVKIAHDIKKFYNDYDGFVVLHGTDTMSYTASALSFMLVNLGKTVVVTGSQIPLSEVRNDAVSNLFGALTMAGLFNIPEVCLYFDNQLFRGNRTQKFDASGLGAFRSGNLPPLATVGVEIEVAWHLIRAAPARPLVLRTITDQNVVALRLFPGISSVLLDSFFQPTVRGVVLETYGAGNVPTTRKDLLSVLKKATDRGIIIVNCTQCFQGTVTGEYAAGTVLKRVGVVSGSDMTPEAALTKLAYLLSQEELSIDQIKSYIGKNIRGELTNKNERHRFSFQEREFVDTIAKVLSQGEQLGINKELSRVMYPVLLCSAGSRGDIEAVERMIGGDISIDMGDYDGRTALHLAAADGQVKMVQFLLDNGADVNVSDRWGATPLQDALRHHQDEIVRVLEGAGGNAQNLGLTRSFCQAVASGQFEDVKTVLAQGANPSEADCDGRTPLHLAASYGFNEIVEFLLKSGARRDMKDRWGATPLDDAKRYNHQSIISTLSKS